MASSYNDFVNAANKAGLLKAFSDDDLKLSSGDPDYGLSLLKLYQDEQNATTAEQRLLAQESINQLRSSYSAAAPTATGGTDTATLAGGSGIATASGGTTTEEPEGSFAYGQQDSYQKLLDSIVNREGFSYDAETDPVYGAYKKQYLREGERATADTLASVSAATGGVPSSYAVTAAQQAGDYYATQLSDMIPTLHENAYQKYLSEFDADLSALGALESDRSFDYNKYLQDYEEEQQRFANALALYQTLGYMTPEIKEALGLSEDTGSGSGSSSGSSGSYGSVNNGGLSYQQIVELQNALGVTADGQYGPQSMAAAGGLSAEEAYALYVGDNVNTDELTEEERAMLDKVTLFAENLRLNMTNSSSDPARIVIGNPELSKEEKIVALEYLVVKGVLTRDRYNEAVNTVNSLTADMTDVLGGK